MNYIIAWAFEFTDEREYGRLYRETNAVKFENYLRASFGEEEMRTHYTLKGSSESVASPNVENAKNYKLAFANYLKTVPLFQLNRHLQRDVDATFMKPPFIPLKTIDTRTQKL